MTFETSVSFIVCLFMPIALYAIFRIAQAIGDIRDRAEIQWDLQHRQNKLFGELITQYTPQTVTLQQIKSELGDHLQQHAARDMRQAGTLNKSDIPAFMTGKEMNEISQRQAEKYLNKSELDTPLETE